MNEIMRLLNVDPLLLQALREDMPGEDVSTNAVMPCACPGTCACPCPGTRACTCSGTCP